jgi:hypothetical protein
MLAPCCSLVVFCISCMLMTYKHMSIAVQLMRWLLLG